MKLILINTKLALFPTLYKAEPYKDSEPRYSAHFLIPHGSKHDKQIEETIKEAAEKEHNDKAEKWLKTVRGQATKCCYVDAEVKNSFSSLDGMILSAIRQEKKGPPAVIDRAKNPITAASGILYPGCTVNAVLDIWIQGGEHAGVRCRLDVVQFVADGEPLSNDVPDVSELPDLDPIDDIGDLV